MTPLTPYLPPKMSSNPISVSGLEKHAQTAIQVILVAITIWVGSSIITLRDSSIRLEEQTKQLRETLSDMKAQIASMQSIIAASSERQNDNQHRIQALEQDVDGIQKRLNAGRGR